jgi:hypothetical protein
MQPFQQRVIDEKAALDEKLVKLQTFIKSESFLTLDPMDRLLLIDQQYSMQDYSEILTKRIARFDA